MEAMATTDQSFYESFFETSKHIASFFPHYIFEAIEARKAELEALKAYQIKTQSPEYSSKILPEELRDHILESKLGYLTQHPALFTPSPVDCIPQYLSKLPEEELNKLFGLSLDDIKLKINTKDFICH